MSHVDKSASDTLAFVGPLVASGNSLPTRQNSLFPNLEISRRTRRVSAISRLMAVYSRRNTENFPVFPLQIGETAETNSLQTAPTAIFIPRPLRSTLGASPPFRLESMLAWRGLRLCGSKFLPWSPPFPACEPRVRIGSPNYFRYAERLGDICARFRAQGEMKSPVSGRSLQVFSVWVFRGHHAGLFSPFSRLSNRWKSKFPALIFPPIWNV